MKIVFQHKTGWFLLLGLVLAAFSIGMVAHAACGPANASDACSTSYGFAGAFSAVSGRAGQPGALSTIDQTTLPMAGALFYQDYKALETQARTLLTRNMNFREDISPYQGLNNFDQLIRHFDLKAGFNQLYQDQDQSLPQMTLQERIDRADGELRQARDLYAYLLVYADAARLRQDDGTNPAFPGADYKNTFCAQAEDPNPADPQHSGKVLEPLIDWCDFGARLRQSVREAAYLRLIFAQQFMVDALGLHFSGGELLGGEPFVREEVARLRAAQYQYELAQKGLTEALDRPLGSGCAVADFFTQTEWALLSRAATGQQQAQHQLGVRLSYLDINAVDDVARAQANAQSAFRAAATDGYLKLIGTAGMALIQPPRPSCAKGTRPDSKLVAEMALNMLDTSNKARELRQGRNIFGFDIAFTPARPYHTAFGSNDKGLWEQAKEAAELALSIQQQTENAERTFDLNQEKLADAILAVNNKVDYDIQKEAGCDRQGFGNDAAWYACVQTMITESATCDPTQDSFDGCMARTTDGKPAAVDCSNCVILVSDMRKARQDLRIAYLGVRAAQNKLNNMMTRRIIEENRNLKVRSAILTGAKDSALFEALSAAANCCSLTFEKSGVSFTVNPGAAFDVAARPVHILRQAANEIEVEDANSLAVVQNLFLDIAEAQGEIDTAAQAYNSMLTEYNGVVGQTGHDVIESQRQHAYAVALPANDPSYRLVRDSRRLELAKQLELAARLAYLAARRAEYETAARLSASNFRISDIYKARTANDVLRFLQGLDATVANLVGGVKDADINQRDLTISVAQQVLGLTDAYLRSQNVADANLATERTQRFQQWVAAHMTLDSNGKAVLRFDFAAAGGAKGLIGQVVQQGYDAYWLHKIGGIGQPKPANNGFGLNLVTTQPGALGYRQVQVSQTGQVVLTSAAGCQFDYRLLPPAVLLGLEFPNSQPTDVVAGLFNGDVNSAHGNGTAGYSTPAFLGRPLASNGWQVVIYAASPDGILPDLDLQQLTDIELKVSTTYATRAFTGAPQPAQCVRVDF